MRKLESTLHASQKRRQRLRNGKRKTHSASSRRKRTGVCVCV
jgi:hypothetical protein